MSAGYTLRVRNLHRGDATPHVYHYRWVWELQASPEALWPFVADTNRFNRDTGVPAVEVEDADDPAVPNRRRRLRLSRFGVDVEWMEEPFEWVQPQRFGVVRRYSRGPVREMRILVDLDERPGGHTTLTYQVWAEPAGWLGRLAIPLQVGVLSGRSFERVVRMYDQAAVAGMEPLDLPEPQQIPSGGRERLQRAGEALRSRGAAPELVDRLAQAVEHADDLTLTRMRPYVLADHWHARRREVLELSLEATRVGMLELQWDVLCPVCRVSKEQTSSLGEVHNQVHCETCGVDFDVNFDQSVELTFRPSPAIRRVEGREFCLGGPLVTPQVVAQALVPAGGEVVVRPKLTARRYRVRAVATPGGHWVEAEDGGDAATTCTLAPDGWSGNGQSVSRKPELRFRNDTAEERLFVLEYAAWTNQAATAAEVTALQRFRDLFSSEVLRPGERIAIGNLTFLFTDLRDSTRFYREVGDAPAFAQVMAHFDVLRDAITSNEGAIVKTAGDSVMAVFSRPVGALRSVLQAKQALAAAGSGIPHFRVKAGIHQGPCVAVNSNDRLDYFGTTVNLCARLEGLSTGHDIVLSEAVYRDPEVEADLGAATTLDCQAGTAEVKGFDGEPVAIWRITSRE